MSNFNYCLIAWHFCGETNTRKIEKIQERALRFIYEDYKSDDVGTDHLT
jgi:predicted nuclease of predicted toxin-antitoxin system